MSANSKKETWKMVINMIISVLTANRGAVAVNSPGMSEAIPRVWGSPVGLFIFTP